MQEIKTFQDRWDKTINSLNNYKIKDSFTIKQNGIEVKILKQTNIIDKKRAENIYSIKQDFDKYISSLKVNDKIEISSFGSIDIATIDKINLKRGKASISSLSITRDNLNYSHKIETSNICYKGVKYENLLNSYNSTFIYVSSFSDYNNENLDRILSVYSLA